MRILLAWELGGAWGHISRFSPVVRALLRRGHEVFVAARDPERTAPHIPGATLVPSPARATPPGGERLQPASFADILYDCGWHSDASLEQLTTAWRRCIEGVAPDVLVLEYAPTALLASQASTMHRVLLSTGFSSPPDMSPLPNLAPGVSSTPSEAQCAREAGLLERCNQFLRGWGCEPLSRLAQLFTRADLDILATWPELDHYGARRGAHYAGVWADSLGEPPRWPAGRGPRVFAYLKEFPALPALLHMLRRSELPVLAYLDNAGPETRGVGESDSVRIVEAPVDVTVAARESDLAILNGGHGASAMMLLGGTPILEIPIFLEQFLVARRVAELGAGQVASQDSPQQIARGLKRLLTDMRYTRSAEVFRKRYRRFDPAQAIEAVVERILSPLPGEQRGSG